jgi:hypothetical protein
MRTAMTDRPLWKRLAAFGLTLFVLFDLLFWATSGGALLSAIAAFVFALLLTIVLGARAYLAAQRDADHAGRKR